MLSREVILLGKRRSPDAWSVNVGQRVGRGKDSAVVAAAPPAVAAGAVGSLEECRVNSESFRNAAIVPSARRQTPLEEPALGPGKAYSRRSQFTFSSRGGGGRETAPLSNRCQLILDSLRL